MLTQFTPGVVVEFAHRERAIRFFVRNIVDVVQNAHLNGRFYESEQLEVIERFLRPGGVFLDVGSNVGNHAIYVASFCEPSEVILVEPNPEALALLRINLQLNRFDLDIAHLGLGLSDRDQAADPKTPVNNLGGAKMAPAEGGSVRLVAGDSLFGGRSIDFIKIDVEGHELAVLAGLSGVIAASRPPIFIEVDNANEAAFQAWMAEHDYEVAHAFPRYRNQDLVIRPKAGGPA